MEKQQTVTTTVTHNAGSRKKGQAGNKQRNRQKRNNRGKKGDKTSTTTKTIVVKAQKANAKNERAKDMKVERMNFSSRREAEQHVRGLVTQLLSTSDMSPGEGIRVPRILSRPVAARKLPFSYKIPPEDIADSRFQIRLSPDPYRTIVHTINNASSVVQPDPDSIWQDVDTTLDPGSKICLASDNPTSLGIMKFDSFKPAAQSDLKHLDLRGHNVQDGAVGLFFGSLNLNNDVALKFIPKITSYNPAVEQARCTMTVYGNEGTDGYPAVATIQTPFIPIENGATTDLNFADIDWTNFADTVNGAASTRVLSIVFEIVRDDNQPIESTHVIGLDWSAAKPQFTAPLLWRSVSVFDMMGEAGNVLKQEIDNVRKGAVTQANFKVSDFVAKLNTNGTLSASQFPASSLKDIPTDPDKAITAIDLLGIPEYSWKSVPEYEGLTWVAHFDETSEWDRRPSRFFVERGDNLDDIDLPVAVLAANFSGNISPGGSHPIKIVGSLNYEWETTSLAFDLRFPPSNYSRFNEAYFQAISKECPFTHNPTHLKEIAKKIEAVMKHPLTKHVIKTIADVGVAALMTL